MVYKKEGCVADGPMRAKRHGEAECFRSVLVIEDIAKIATKMEIIQLLDRIKRK